MLGKPMFVINLYSGTAGKGTLTGNGNEAKYKINCFIVQAAKSQECQMMWDLY